MIVHADVSDLVTDIEPGRLLLDGSWVPATSGATMEVVDPVPARWSPRPRPAGRPMSISWSVPRGVPSTRSAGRGSRPPGLRRPGLLLQPGKPMAARQQ